MFHLTCLTINKFHSWWWQSLRQLQLHKLTAPSLERKGLFLLQKNLKAKIRERISSSHIPLPVTNGNSQFDKNSSVCLVYVHYPMIIKSLSFPSQKYPCERQILWSALNPMAGSTWQNQKKHGVFRWAQCTRTHHSIHSSSLPPTQILNFCINCHETNEIIGLKNA